MTTEAASRSEVRRAGIVVVVGALLYVLSDLAELFGLIENLYRLPEADRLAALEANRTAWDISRGLAGIGLVIAAVGLFMLGRAVARAAADDRSRVMATVAGWAGAATGLWAISSFLSVVRPAEDVVAALEEPTVDVIVTGLIYLVGVVVLFVALGLTLRRLGHKRTLGWSLIFVGTLAALSMPVFGALLPSMVMLALGIGMAADPYPPPNRSPNTELAST